MVGISPLRVKGANEVNLFHWQKKKGAEAPQYLVVLDPVRWL